MIEVMNSATSQAAETLVGNFAVSNFANLVNDGSGGALQVAGWLASCTWRLHLSFTSYFIQLPGSCVQLFFEFLMACLLHLRR